MNLNPEIVGVLILLLIVLCAEVGLHRRATVVKRTHGAEIVSRVSERGFVVLLLLIPVALFTWTAGWVLGQKRICDQTMTGCDWKTGTAWTPQGKADRAWDAFGKAASGGSK